MNTPNPPQYAPDPMLVQQEQKAQNDQFAALQTRAQGDTESLMARYGTLAAYLGAAPGSSSSPIAGVLSAANSAGKL